MTPNDLRYRDLLWSGVIVGSAWVAWYIWKYNEATKRIISDMMRNQRQGMPPMMMDAEQFHKVMEDLKTEDDDTKPPASRGDRVDGHYL